MNTAFSPSGRFLFQTLSQVGIYEGGIRVLPGLSRIYSNDRIVALRHVAHFPTRSPMEWREMGRENRNRRQTSTNHHGVVRVQRDVSVN